MPLRALHKSIQFIRFCVFLLLPTLLLKRKVCAKNIRKLADKAKQSVMCPNIYGV